MTDLSALGLGRGIVTMLREQGVRSVEELKDTTAVDLLKMPNIGKKRLFDIEMCLERYWRLPCIPTLGEKFDRAGFMLERMEWLMHSEPSTKRWVTEVKGLLEEIRTDVKTSPYEEREKELEAICGGLNLPIGYVRNATLKELFERTQAIVKGKGHGRRSSD